MLPWRRLKRMMKKMKEEATERRAVDVHLVYPVVCDHELDQLHGG